MRHLAERHIACPVTRHNKIYTFDSVTTFRCALHYNAIALINDKHAKIFYVKFLRRSDSIDHFSGQNHQKIHNSNLKICFFSYF